MRRWRWPGAPRSSVSRSRWSRVRGCGRFCSGWRLRIRDGWRRLRGAGAHGARRCIGAGDQSQSGRSGDCVAERVMRTWFSRVRALIFGDSSIAGSTMKCRPISSNSPTTIERRGMTAEQARSPRDGRSAASSRSKRYRDRRGCPGSKKLATMFATAARARRRPVLPSSRSPRWRWASARTRRSSGLLDAVLLRPLPVARPHELVMATLQAGNRQFCVFAASQFNALRVHRDALADLAAFAPLSMRVGTRGDVEFTPGQLVSGHVSLLPWRADDARSRLDRGRPHGG